MVHAENGDVIDYLTKKALAEGNTDPIYHALTRPPEVEGEATGRAAHTNRTWQILSYMWFMFHVRMQLRKLRKPRNKGFDVWGETCPQYLVLDQSYLEKPNFEGAKYVWSPPLREKWNQDVLMECLEKWSTANARI